MANKGNGIDGFKYLGYVVTEARIRIDAETWVCQHAQWDRLQRRRGKFVVLSYRFTKVAADPSVVVGSTVSKLAITGGADLCFGLLPKE